MKIDETTAQPDLVVLQDAAGAYYLLSRAALEAARVPAEDVPLLEAAMRGDDTSGFFRCDAVRITGILPDALRASGQVGAPVQFVTSPIIVLGAFAPPPKG